MKDLWKKIQRKLLHLRLQPIRVFCFHSVSDEYNPLTTWECDWLQTDVFKHKILELNKQYTFISLEDAYEKMKHDIFRFRKYAVLTADDGYRSILNILPWLEEQQIPITLFINTKYLDGQSWSEINEEQSRRAKADVDMLTEVCPNLYVSKDELFALTSEYVSVGIHGHEHIDATKQSKEDFHSNVEQCREILIKHPRYIPFMAYTWGRYSKITDSVLRELDIVPVLANGDVNYKYRGHINRQIITD